MPVMLISGTLSHPILSRWRLKSSTHRDLWSMCVEHRHTRLDRCGSTLVEWKMSSNRNWFSMQTEVAKYIINVCILVKTLRWNWFCYHRFTSVQFCVCPTTYICTIPRIHFWTSLIYTYTGTIFFIIVNNNYNICLLINYQTPLCYVHSWTLYVTGQVIKI